MTVHEFQQQIERLYLEKDRDRGWQETFIWFVEEVGELGRALRSEPRAQVEAEFADVFAWLVTLASIHGVDLETVAQAKYGAGCPKCHATPCACGERTKAEGQRRRGIMRVEDGGMTTTEISRRIRKLTPEQRARVETLVGFLEAETDADRLARVNAVCGKYANVVSSSDEFAGRKQEEIDRER